MHTPSIGQILDAFRSSLLHLGNDEHSLSWLVEEIDRQLSEAESVAATEWLASHPLTTTRPDSLLTDAQRMSIALQIAYHHLVVVPHMLIHVHEYWQKKAPGGIFL